MCNIFFYGFFLNKLTWAPGIELRCIHTYLCLSCSGTLARICVLARKRSQILSTVKWPDVRHRLWFSVLVPAKCAPTTKACGMRFNMVQVLLPNRYVNNLDFRFRYLQCKWKYIGRLNKLFISIFLALYNNLI